MRFVFLLAALVTGLLTTDGWIESVTTQSIPAGDTLVLSDGRTIHLQGIKAIPAAQEFLRSFLGGKKLSLSDGNTDRYGRMDTQVFASTGAEKPSWLQGELLTRGLAFIYPPTGHEARLTEMFAAENSARRAHTGLWAEAAYAELPAANPTAIPTGQFVFVVGKVIKAERVKDKFYLNFGDNWRDDFTIAIAAHDLKTFRKEGADPAGYEGKTVRVRGWVIRNFGPMITVTHPAQVETLN